MYQLIKNWLKKPYPFPTTIIAKSSISLSFGVFIFLFLLIFKPFNFALLEERSLYFAQGYGIITTVLMLINLFIFPFLFPDFFKASAWVIYKMILFVIWLLLLISSANWFFSIYSFDAKNLEGHNFPFFLIVTILIGFFPLLFYLFISERVITKHYKSIATNVLNNKTKSPIPIENKYAENSIIKLIGDNQRDEFQVNLQDLLFISSEKNYASIYYIENKQVKEHLLRTTLTKIEAQTHKNKSIIRCHKSYIVNTHKVVKIQGNARSFLLRIKNLNDLTNDFIIPVSRNFPKELLFTLIP